jgi:hypothetical protein
MTVAGIFLIIAPILLDSSQDTRSVLQALGTSLFASALFSGVYLFFTNREFIELLAEQMEALQASGTRQIVQYLAQTNPTYLPMAVYEPTDNDSTPFSRDLMASLSASQTYRFQGLTGYWVPIRLETAKTTLSVLRVCLADTSDHAALRLRITREIALGPTKDYASVVANVKEQAIQGAVGLLEVRGRCQSIELSWTSEPTCDRYEIFDADVYITTFDSGTPSTKYPKSLKFGRNSFIYDMALRRFDLHFSGTNTKMVTIRPEDSNELILEKLQKAGLNIDPNLYKECAERFWRDVENNSGRRSKVENNSGRRSKGAK